MGFRNRRSASRDEPGRSVFRRGGTKETVRNASDWSAAANDNAFGTDEERAEDGHDICPHNACEDDGERGIDVQIDEAGDIPFRGRVNIVNEDQQAPRGSANVSAERVEEDEATQPDGGGKEKDASPSGEMNSGGR